MMQNDLISRRMTDREKLIELVAAALCNQSIEEVAEHLLANGVIVPPYEPMPFIDEGDRVLCPICETDLMGRYIGYDNTPTVVTCYECGAWIDSTKALD